MRIAVRWKRWWIWNACAIQAWMSLCLAVTPAARPIHATDRPNFVVVLCDDLGYGDLHCYGNQQLHTPNVDQFAAEGLRLTSCYAAHPNCSPSRTGLLTGRTPTRVGIHNWIPMFSPMHVPTSEITIATLLRDAGYDTALSGKWHLNGRFNMTGQPQPGDHGFNHWFATQNNCLPNHKNPYNFVRNGIPLGPLRGYAADLVSSEAIYWLRELRDKSKPFFLFVSFHEPHEPIATKEQYQNLYPSEDPSYAAHHGNITQMDTAFGELMIALDDLQLRDNTFVFFTSDNGPARTRFHPNGSAGPLRDKKGFISEGGIRVPGIIRWPGRTQAGAIDGTPICGTDILPTCCEIAGIPIPQDRTLDGSSILPLFEGRSIERATPLYWHFYAARGKQRVAIRIGDWKLAAELDAVPAHDRAGIDARDQQGVKAAQLGTMALYNLVVDIGETMDWQASEPERFAQMREILQSKYREIQSESPKWPAWTCARYESQRIAWPAYRGAQRVPLKAPRIPPIYVDNPDIETIE
ncbi:MAG: sulfatase-like hydrolase/transferase [Pirellulaceae bacterium]|nr:sulfatase-like hydrolase/transferase [Pirellulaceae bacterium]